MNKNLHPGKITFIPESGCAKEMYKYTGHKNPKASSNISNVLKT
jgi:hypothetical protein